MGWRLAPLGRFLDPRPRPEAEASPYPEAVNIPFEELPHRLHELPPKDEPVLVLDLGPDAIWTIAFLDKGGRRASRTSTPQLPPPPGQEEGKQPSPPAPSPFSRERGEGETCRLWRPNPFLEEILPHLPAGNALDLGCGCGREALAMAAAGFRVTAIDHLPDALELGRDLESRYLSPSPFSTQEKRERGLGGEGSAAPIDWIQMDLEGSSTSFPLPPSFPTGRDPETSGARGGGSLSLITSFRYLHRPLFQRVHELLKPGGSFLLETFTELHRQRHGKPRQNAHILQLGEAPTLVPGLKIIHFDEAWRGESHTARLWARKSV